MGITTSEIEALAVAFYERLGFDPSVPIDTFRLARALLGPCAIERGSSIIGVPAKTFMVNGQRRIAVSRRVPLEYAFFYAGHELGHLVLEEQGYRGADIEAVCDTFGAAVTAPMPAVRAMLRVFGRDHEAIAAEVGTTQTHAALRVAECLGIPRAIITPARLYVRGPDSFVWGSEDELRRLARARGVRPGLTKAKLTDDPRRVVLDVDEG